jgi:serine/threonine protein kinase
MYIEELLHATIEHYTIEQHLARGGMADIFLARDQQLPEKIVAIKVVSQGIREHNDRLLREAQAMLSLQHPHILPALGSGSYRSWDYIIMPYLAAGSLRDVIAQGPLGREQTILLFEQIVEAIQYAHDRSILHRDIKASNVLLRDSHYAYLADFGLVKSPTDDYSLTRTGFMIGTPEYMAPELLDKRATTSSDVYALGVLLYEMLTGTLPFRATTPMGIMLKHMQEPPPQATTLNPTLPPAINKVLAHAMMKNPSQRTLSAHALLQEVQTAFDTREDVPVVDIQPSHTLLPRRMKQADGNSKKLLLVALFLVFCEGLFLVFTLPKSSISAVMPTLTPQSSTFRIMPTPTPKLPTPTPKPSTTAAAQTPQPPKIVAAQTPQPPMTMPAQTPQPPTIMPAPTPLKHPAKPPHPQTPKKHGDDK